MKHSGGKTGNLDLSRKVHSLVFAKKQKMSGWGERENYLSKISTEHLISRKETSTFWTSRVFTGLRWIARI